MLFLKSYSKGMGEGRKMKFFLAELEFIRTEREENFVCVMV